jgi:hypothetical protein
MGESIRWDHVAILTRSNARNAMRSGAGLVFLVVALFVGLGIASAMLEPVRLVQSHTEGPATEDLLAKSLEFARPVLAWWIDAEDDAAPQVDFLLTDRPALLSCILLVFLSFVPFLGVLAGFNQTAGDIGARSMRYLLFRTERVNIVVSRLLGTFLFASAVELLLALSFAVSIGFTVDLYTPLDLALWALHGWLAMVLVTLPYLCLCAWVSAANESAGVSLVLSLLLTGFVGVLINIFQGMVQGGAPWLDRLTPWGWRHDLLHPEAGRAALAALMMLAFSALFTTLALRTFGRRDL